MKKFKKVAYIVLILIIAVLSLTIYTNASKNDGETKKEKVLSEIKYVETKLINLLNKMNNIRTDDYNIITTEISQGEESNSSSERTSTRARTIWTRWTRVAKSKWARNARRFATRRTRRRSK